MCLFLVFPFLNSRIDIMGLTYFKNVCVIDVCTGTVELCKYKNVMKNLKTQVEQHSIILH